MANRLELLNTQVKKEPKIVSSSFDFLDLGSLLTPEENVSMLLFSKSESKCVISSTLKSKSQSSPMLKRLSFQLIYCLS